MMITVWGSGEETLMDWDLWGPPAYHIVAEESTFHRQPKLGYDFYSGNGFEEDALNKRCCEQVLRILLMKADTEISELEQEMICLQSELCWFENEDWSELCSNTVMEKTNWLDIATTKLKDKDKNDLEVCLLLDTQPLEPLNEIFQVLLRNYFHKKDEKLKHSADAISSDWSSDGQMHALVPYNEEQQFSEKIKQPITSPTEYNLALNEPVKIKEMMSNLKPPKVEKILVNDLALIDSRNLTGNFNDLKKLCIAIQNKEVAEPSRAKHKRKYSSLKPEDKANTPVNANGHGNHTRTKEVASPDINQRLCEFAFKAMPKCNGNELKVDKASNEDSLCSSLKKIMGRKRSLVKSLKVEENCPVDTENCLLTSLLEVEHQKEKQAEKVRTKKIALAKPIFLEVEAAKNATHDETPNMSLPLTLRLVKVESISNFNTPGIHTVDCSSSGVISSSSVLKYKRKKFGTCQTKNSSNKSSSGRINSVFQLIKYDAEEYSVACDNYPDSLKGRKGIKTAKFVVDAMTKVSTIQGEDLSVINSGSGAVQPLSSSVIADLSTLKLSELRAIAKKHKFPKYYNLRKTVLAERLSSLISNGLTPKEAQSTQ